MSPITNDREAPRAPRSRRLPARRVPARRLLAAVSLFTITACAQAPGTGANRISPAGGGGGSSAHAKASGGAAEVALRNALNGGDAAAITASIARLEGDTLLRLLHWGIAHHRLGRYDASNLALQEAVKLAEDRYTISISQNIGAMLLNDNQLDYTPSAWERAFIHYYGMMNYLHLGNSEGALVEARRANEFLARYERENGARSFTTDATVEYIAGMLHLGAGDRNDAVVSLRKSGAGFDNYRQRYGVSTPRFVGVDLAREARRLGVTEVATDVARAFNLTPQELAPESGRGTLLVVIENGYVARPVEQKVYIPILQSEVNALASGGKEAALTVGVPVIARTVSLFTEAAANAGRSYARPHQDGLLLAGIEHGADFVTMAWPRYVLDQNGAKSVTVSAGNVRQEALLMQDLSAIAARGFEEDKPKILGRMITRSLGKYALVKYGEAKAEAKGGMLGGALAKFGGQLVAAKTEAADVRSWGALPGEILAARFSLPPGTHVVSLEVQDVDGSTRTVEIGPVTIAANATVVKNHFVAGRYDGSATRFANAQRGVDFKATQAVASNVQLSGAARSAAASKAPASKSTAAAPAGTTGSEPAPRETAVIASAAPVVTTFRPLAGESATFAVGMRNQPAAGRRKPAALALLVTPPAGGAPREVWRGVEGDTVKWNGMIGDRPASAGNYRMTLRAATPGAARTSEVTWTAVVDVTGVENNALLPLPSQPSLEPETRSDFRQSARGSRLKRGLLSWGLGIGGMAMGFTMAEEGSEMGEMLFLGSGVLAIGGMGMTLVGLATPAGGPVTVPDAAAIARNEAAREEHARRTADVMSHNARVRESMKVRVRSGPVGR